jgi:hypothetical protein
MALALCAAAAYAQSSSATPVELVRRAVQNEVRQNTDPNAYFMFKDQRKTAHTSQTKLIVETREAAAGMIVEQDGHPLTPQQQQAEEARLQNYTRNPEELARKRKQEKEDADRTMKIVRALPDAFLYEADGTEPGSAGVGKLGVTLVRLKFHPNPDYDPPSREEQVLTGMHGHVLIDTSANRIAEIDATLEKQVAFGWGILGHLDRGGRFLVQQANVSNHEWELTRMELSFTGKILLFKNLAIHSSDVFSDFRPVPANLTFAQGVELLKEELAAEQAGAAKPKPQEAGAKPDQNQNPCCNR